MDTASTNGIKSHDETTRRILDILHLPAQKSEPPDTQKTRLKTLFLTLQEASKAFITGQFSTSSAQYRLVLDLLLKTRPEGDYFHKNLIQYMMCISLTESNHLKDLQEALRSLLDLEQNTENVFPAVYYALAKTHIKFFRFDFALKTINKGFALLNKDVQFLTYHVPGTNHIIRESTREGLLDTLIRLKDKCSGWHRPDAICSMTSCQNYNPQYPPSRNIFYSDPAFTGMVTVMCNATYPCVLKFHPACWKYQKEKMSTLQELSDQDVIGRKCLTPTCQNNRVHNKIAKIEVFDKDSDTKAVIEAPEAPMLPKQEIPVKGAIKKQCQESQVYTFQSLNAVQHPSLQQTPVKKMPLDEEIENSAEWRIRKLKSLRKNNFGISMQQNWQPDREMYGNEYVNATQELISDPDFTNKDSETAQLKSFSFGLLYEYIKTNGPVTTEDVSKKWDETKTIIQNSDRVLDDHLDIIEFLLQSPKIAMVGNYMCTPQVLPQVYSLLKLDTIKEFKDVVGDKTKLEKHENVLVNNGDAVTRNGYGKNEVFQKSTNIYGQEKNTENVTKCTEEGIVRNGCSNEFDPEKNPLKGANGFNEKQTNYFCAISALKEQSESKEKPVGSIQKNPFLYSDGADDVKDHATNFLLTPKNFGSNVQYTSTPKQNNNIDNTNMFKECVDEIENYTPMGNKLDRTVQELISLRESAKSNQELMDQIVNFKPVADSLLQEKRVLNRDFGQTNLFENAISQEQAHKLKLLLNEKDSTVAVLVEQNENLRQALQNLQSSSKHTLEQYNVLQQNLTTLKADMNLLWQERCGFENNVKLLQAELNEVRNTYEEKCKSLSKESETYQTELNLKIKEMDALKLGHFNWKKMLLQRLLDCQCSSNKNFITRNMELCNIALETISKVNYIYQRNLGFHTLSDNAEWLQALSGFHKVSADHQGEYLRLKTLLESKEEIEKMDDIALTLTNMPRFPSRPLSEAVYDAFNKYSVHMTQIMQHSTAMLRTGSVLTYQPATSAPATLAVPQNNMPHYQTIQSPVLNTYLQFNNAVTQSASYLNKVDVYKGDMQKEEVKVFELECTDKKDTNNNKDDVKNINNIKVQNKEVKGNNEESTKIEETKKLIEISRENNDHQNSGGEYTNENENSEECRKELERTTNDKKENPLNEYENDMESTACYVQDKKETVTTKEANDSKKDFNETSKQQCCKNLDKIMLKLQTKYPGIMNLDLLESVMSVRKAHNNTLTGLPIDVITQEAEKYILNCQKKLNILDLCDNTAVKKDKPFKNQPILSTNFARPQTPKRQPVMTKLEKKKTSKLIPSSSLQMLTELGKNDRKRLNSAPSDFTEDSVKNKSQPPTPAKCPWNQIPTRNETWKKESLETECIICMENITTSKPVYTLTCQHTFHLACIKNWYQHNQSCPNCRVHCTIDDEYPPLP